MLEYVKYNYLEIIRLIIEHLQITVLAVLIAILIGVPLGIFISYVKGVGPRILGMANIIQAIPSLALLGFLIPFLGIGFKPAVFMVVVYSLLPIIKNTAASLGNISSDIEEAATGVGLTPFQILYKVKLPLALPVIMAGVRISAVMAVGLVTIAAFIGAGGLGYLVYSGIRTVNNVQILAGAIPACLLALGIDFFVALIEKAVSPIALRDDIKSLDKHLIKQIRRRQRTGFIAVAVLLIAVICFSLFSTVKTSEKHISIGAKDFTEQSIIASIYAELIEAKTDIEVDRRLDLGGTQIVFSALTNRQLDLYIEYTGTLYTNILKREEKRTTEEIFSLIQRELTEEYDLALLEPVGFNNTYAIAVRAETAQQYNLKTLSDLARVSQNLRISPTLEFMNRADGINGMMASYGMEFLSVRPLDGTPRYTALMNDQCDVIDVFSTDGLIREYGLVVLKDDLQYFPNYNAIPLLYADTLERYPELRPVLEQLEGKIGDDDMRELNYRVDVLHEKPEEVAKDYLLSRGFI
ncbi:ABC transporter permease [Paenibacillus selenitireducens]|uniref:ABC transporter permease n=1 Tax=Paenibacillus selenitireducens TaxID=1324314 RepID=A0A1T2X4I2_9BACL|nr:ABC transporter permease [Paenibacillus selenitireducens]